MFSSQKVIEILRTQIKKTHSYYIVIALIVILILVQNAVVLFVTEIKLIASTMI